MKKKCYILVLLFFFKVAPTLASQSETHSHCNNLHTHFTENTSDLENIASALTSSERVLSRTTRAELRGCDAGQYSQTTPQAAAVIEQVTQRIFQANPEVFTGDLAPEHICHGLVLSGNRAWAQADTRSFNLEGDLFTRFQNADQLAWTISHELSHITMRHGLDGLPIPSGVDLDGNGEPDATELQALQLEFVELRERQATVSANDVAAMAAMSAEVEAVARRIRELSELHLGPEEINSWQENEADEVALRYYLRAGFAPEEVAWRQEQLAIAESRGLDPHSPPQYTSTPARVQAASTACGFSGGIATSPEPDRGGARYPSACWSIWSLKRQSSELLAINTYSRAPTDLNAQLTAAQQEVREQQQVNANLTTADPKNTSK